MATIDYKQKIKDYMNSSEVDTLYKSMLNNLFPELVEPENERMWKLIKKYAHCNISDMALNADHITREQLESWLEKQGKTSPDLSNSSNIGKVERNPADNKGMNLKEEEMTPFQKEVFYIIDTNIEAEVGLKQECDELLRLAHDEIMQNTAWSEEDEEMLNSIIEEVRYIGDFPDYPTKEENELYDECLAKVDWLKSLKDRVQPKQEWSEEDDSKLEEVLYYIEYINRTNVTFQRTNLTHLINWLKSLRPQNTWKPSDSQMASITCAVRKMKESACYDSELVSLFNDLKKLKGEEL